MSHIYISIAVYIAFVLSFSFQVKLQTWLIDCNHIYTEGPSIWFDGYVLHVMLPSRHYFGDWIGG